MGRTNVQHGPWRIVHVLAPAPFGGLESVVRLLAAGQSRRGHDVTVVCSVEAADHPLTVALRADGLTVHEIVVGGRQYSRERREFAALMSRVRPHVVHSHGYRPDILHLGRARRAGAVTVTTLHGFTGGGRRVGLYEWLQVRAARRASAAIAVSQGVAHRLSVGSPRARVEIIRNAYGAAVEIPTRRDARERLGMAHDALAIGWIGRLSPEKGPDVALESFARMTETTASLHFIGAGPEEALLRARARSLGLSSRVHFHGAVNGAGELLRAFDALLLSSRTEGTPMVVLEAMAAETPIVAANVGGVPYILPMGSALLAPSEDAGAFAAALDATLSDRTAAAARARAAAAVLRSELGVEPWLDRHDELYGSLIE